MDETVGQRTYSAPPQPFLGTPAGGIEASATTEREIDVAVRDIIAKAFEQATAILRTRRADLDEGGRLLLAQETLTADQFPAIRPLTKQPETVGWRLRSFIIACGTFRYVQWMSALPSNGFYYCPFFLVGRVGDEFCNTSEAMDFWLKIFHVHLIRKNCSSRRDCVPKT
jgi:hypothetical protein